MPIKRPQTLIPAVIALVAVTAFVVLWVGTRTAMARRMVASSITQTVGLPATVESLRIGFLPWPALDIGGLAIAQPPGFGPEPLIEIGRLQASIPWGSVFSPTDFATLSISDAIARLTVDVNGEANWSALFNEPAAASPVAASPAWSIGEFALERGTIEYADKVAGSRWQLTAINIEATDVAPTVPFPLELQLGGVFDTNIIHYAMTGQARLDLDAGRYEASGVEFRGWAGGEPLPLAGVELTGAMKRAAFESATGVATLAQGSFRLAGIPGEFDATMHLDEPALQAEFRMTTDAFEPRAPAIILGHPLPVTSHPQAFGSLQLALQGRLKDGGLELDPVSGRLDDTNFEARVVPAQRLIRANLDRINVNHYLAPEVKTTSKKKATLEAAVAELAEFDIDAEIRIAEAVVAGAKLRDVVIRVEREEDKAL